MLVERVAFGTTLLQLALGLAATGAILAALMARGSLERQGRTLSLVSYGSAAALTLALALLVAKFLFVDVDTFYVWRYTHREHPWYYRLSGVWGGQAGTLLLWAWYTSLVPALLRWRARAAERRLAFEGRPAGLAVVGLLLAMVAVLVGLALDQGLFTPTSEFRVHEMGGGDMAMREFVHAPRESGPSPDVVMPDGFGLNPLLLTPFMVIHPWIEFAAYALSAVLFAHVLAYLFTEDRSIVARTIRWARATWLVYTTAIALGALWAYYTLSFGGYWAWDPVETANLLPWLALTAYLHVATLQKRHGDADWIAPLLGASVFLLTLLATFLTRSGVWNGSVHAFITDGVLDVQDAGARLLAIMTREPHVGHLLRVLGGATLLTTLAFLHRAWRHADSRRRAPVTVMIAIHAGLFAWIVLAPESLVETLIAAARRVSPESYALPLASALSLALAGPGIYLYVSAPDKVATPGPRITHRRTLRAAAALLSLSLAVLLVLLLWGVNGTQRLPYDQRAPVLVLGIAGVLALHFWRTALGARWSLLLVASATVVGILAAWLLPDEGPVVLAAPMVALALLGVLASLLAAARRHGASWRESVASMTLLASGVLGLIMWTSPPAELDLFIARIAIGPSIVAAGLLASVLGLLAGCAVLSRSRARTWLAAASTLAWGYGVGSLLALVGLALARGARSEGFTFPQAVQRTSVHLIHMGVVLALLGYGASTYWGEAYSFTTEAPLERGVPASMGPYAVTFESADGIDADADGVYESIDTRLALDRGGSPLGTAVLRMAFVPAKDHYDPTTLVWRGARGDVYLNANFANAHAMYSEADGWVRGHGPTSQIHSEEITKLALDIRILPGTNFLWAGIVLGVLAMGARIASRPRAPSSARG